MPDKQYDRALLLKLYEQLEEISNHFKEMRMEAAGIAEGNQMPDATLHLNDVLKATEDATITILDAANTIGAAMDKAEIPADVKQPVSDQVMRIYEACSFQDISGQRIKKVLGHLNELEAQLLSLAEMSKAEIGEKRKPKESDSLLNGPALASETPTQTEIDDIFKNV